MLLLLFKRFLRKSAPSGYKNSESKPDPEQWVALIKQGDELQREQFIADYKPYIVKVTSRFSKRYIDPSKDDEFSVALLAFNEAINQFDSQAGKSFLGFAETVIRRRLIDYVRKEQKHLQTVPYSMYDAETEDQPQYNSIETLQALSAYETKQTDTDRRGEIEELSMELENYGITFLELVDHSPKHKDSRQLLIGIARVLAMDAKLMDIVRQTRRLPIKELMELCAVSRKTIERNRKYIISIALILTGTYPFLNDYLQINDDETRLNREASQ